MVSGQRVADSRDLFRPVISSGAPKSPIAMQPVQYNTIVKHVTQPPS